MNEQAPRTPDVRIRRLSFPWPSALGGLLVAAYLLLLTGPDLVAFYGIPDIWFQAPIQYAVPGIFILLLLFDLRRFHHRRSRQRADIHALRQQVDELWNRNRELQLKAHTYSGHADRLKLFISDKLLDYIEYDEKFLHFKGIAAEVRHNGVISFDKVQTALKRAHAAALSDAAAGLTRNQDVDYEAALNAMRYLWDLLDLSTADNLALHIGNHLCECEEHYCQRLLNPEAPPPLPHEPAFSPQQAAWRALNLVHSGPPPLKIRGQETDEKHEAPGSDQAESDRGFEVYALDDEHWHVRLADTGELLGNENHLVLMLDNLLKNAQFFSRKRKGKRGTPAIALNLEEHQGQAVFRVYNRGPHIQEEDRERLFQLGFSTRRTRDHHGRGLGLYFVNEIVKAYEGRIRIHNIHALEAHYQLHIKLENGQSFTHNVEVAIIDGKPRCISDENTAEEESPEKDESGQSRQSWTLPSAVRHVEVSSDHDTRCHRLEDFKTKGQQERLDPAHPDRPHWRLRYQPHRRGPRLGFEPLDITGVEFEIRLPTARHRLESGQSEVDDDLEAEVERLGDRFGTPFN